MAQRWTCDRCGDNIKWPGTQTNKITLHQVQENTFDICDACMTLLKEWLAPLIEEEKRPV